MIKKTFLLSTLLLLSGTTVRQLPAKPIDQEVENSQKNIQIIEELYQAAIAEYNKKDIEKYENKIKQILEEYITSSIKNEKNIKNIKKVEKLAEELLNYFQSKTTLENACATASMMLMANWSKLLLKFAEEITSQQKGKNLQQANNEIQKIFQTLIDPVTKQLEKIAKQLEEA